jgi:hypothetical protein
VADGEDHLGAQVRQIGDQPAGQGVVGGRQRRHLTGAPAVGPDQAGPDVRSQLVPLEGRGGGAGEGAGGGGAAIERAVQAARAQEVDHAVDGLLGHPPHGGQLAAGHVEDAVAVDPDVVLARDGRRTGGVAGQQRAQAGEGRDHLTAPQGSGREGVVGGLQEVVDVRPPGPDLVVGGGGVGGGVAVSCRGPIRVGRPDDGARAGGEGEHQPPIPRRVDDDHPSGGWEPGGVDHQVHPQRRPENRLARAEGIREWTGGVDHRPRGDGEGSAAVAVDDGGRMQVTAALQGRYVHVGGDHRASPLGVEHVLQDQAEVVGLAVHVEGGPVEPGRAQQRGELVDLAGPHSPAGDGRAPQGQGVVQGHPQAEHGEGGAAVPVSGEEELHRAAEVGGGGEQVAPLAQPFPHQLEVAVLQVSQPSVDELRGVAGGLAGKVAVLAQGHAEAAQGRVPGHRRAGGAAPDHQDVEALVGQPGQRRLSPPSPSHGAPARQSVRPMPNLTRPPECRRSADRVRAERTVLRRGEL